MIVDHLSTGATGGAALAAERLHKSLTEQGVQSRLWCAPRAAARAKLTGEAWRPLRWRQPATGVTQMMQTVKEWVTRRRTKRSQQQVMGNLPPETEYFSFADTGRQTSLDRAKVDGDILHLHWIAGLVDYESFFASLPSDLPIAWTLHDVNPLTGGCHYAGDCSAFETGCKQCPQLGAPATIDHAARNFAKKRAAYSNRKLHVLAPSQWIADAAKKSALLQNADVKMIRHGIDTNTFQPTDKSEAKRALGIDPAETVIGFGADSLRNPRKGMSELLESLAKMGCRPNVRCLLFGNGAGPNNTELIPPITHAGFVADPRQLAEIYSASDLFVFPTKGEACGLTGVEAMACETPVVAFDAPGVNEYVLHDETGLVAPLGGTSELAQSITRLIDDADLRRRLGGSARRLAEREFHRDKQASLYVQWYESILSQCEPSVRRVA